MKTIYFEIMDGFGIMFGWKRPKQNNKWKFYKIKASEGHILTDGENYGKIVYLAQGDEGKVWYEITEAEYEAEYEAKMAEREAHAENQI